MLAGVEGAEDPPQAADAPPVAARAADKVRAVMVLGIGFLSSVPLLAKTMTLVLVTTNDDNSSNLSVKNARLSSRSVP